MEWNEGRWNRLKGGEWREREKEKREGVERMGMIHSIGDYYIISKIQVIAIHNTILHM